MKRVLAIGSAVLMVSALAGSPALRACWSSLRAPIKRLGAPRTPVPYSVPLEDAVKVTVAQIVEAARQMARAG